MPHALGDDADRSNMRAYPALIPVADAVPAVRTPHADARRTLADKNELRTLRLSFAEELLTWYPAISTRDLMRHHASTHTSVSGAHE